MLTSVLRGSDSKRKRGEFSSNESTFVTDDLAQCRCCVSLVTRCAFDVHLAVGTTRRPTQHGFSGIPVRFLSLMCERRASLEKTLSLAAHRLCILEGNLLLARIKVSFGKDLCRSTALLQSVKKVIHVIQGGLGVLHRSFCAKEPYN